jgi:predicted N-acetyltransferase YhbS
VKDGRQRDNSECSANQFADNANRWANIDMSSNATIRPERPADTQAISRVTELAFRLHPHSSHTEHFIINGLRRSGALSVSLVAEVEGEVVGHIAFSPVTIADDSRDWYGLGPVSVEPGFQRRGIGKSLIEAGLAALRSLNAEGCVVLGEPGFYDRFGFSSRAECFLEGVPAGYFQSLAFGRHQAVGKVTYHAAFDAQS